MRRKLAFGILLGLSFLLILPGLGLRAQRSTEESIELSQSSSQASACSVPVDSDGLPVNLSGELSTIQKAIESKRDVDKVKKTAYGNLDQTTRITVKEFTRQWPLAAETKNLHQRLLSLSEKLESTANPEEANNMRREYYAVAQQLASDKCYVQILRAIATKYPESTTIKPEFY